MGILKQTLAMGAGVVGESRPKLTPWFFISSILRKDEIMPSVLPKRAKIKVYKLSKFRAMIRANIQRMAFLG